MKAAPTRSTEEITMKRTLEQQIRLARATRRLIALEAASARAALDATKVPLEQARCSLILAGEAMGITVQQLEGRA